MSYPTEFDNRIFHYLNLLSPEADGYYDAMLSEEKDIRIWRELSVLRTGLFSWYPLKPDASVLEIDAGYGALTGVLCDRCGKVTATERNEIRAERLATRWAAKDQLTVRCGDITSIDFKGETFDYIVLTGLLERVSYGSAERSGYAVYLRLLKKLLKKGGRILVSVDNRFALRYLCGAPETHTGRAFASLADYPEGTDARSFTHAELSDILQRAGFSVQRFYYPLPDYTFPQLVYTDEYLPGNDVAERLIPYYPKNDTLVANELALYRDIAENRSLPFVANSFLVEAATDKRPPEEEPAHAVYAAISTDRGPDRAYATVVYSDDTVRKMPLFEESMKGTKRLYDNMRDLTAHGVNVVPHVLVTDQKRNEAGKTADKDRGVFRVPEGTLEMPRAKWPTFSNYLKEHAHRITAEELTGFVTRLYDIVLQASEEVPADNLTPPGGASVDGSAGEKAAGNALLAREIAWIRAQNNVHMTEEKKAAQIEAVTALDFGPVLKKAYTELISMNCFINPQTNELQFFDQEFVRENYPAKYVLFRIIFYIYCHAPECERILPRAGMIAHFGMESLWEVFQHEEDRFQYENRNRARYAQFYRWTAIDDKRIRENPERLMSEEERIAHYRVSDKMKKVWNVELQMLDEVERICKAHGLTYMLVHGSLLGAVRHKGFIPWDDDLDIAMPRDDYDRFIKIARKELKPPLSVQTMFDEPDLFFGPYAKIRNSETCAITQRDVGHEGNLGIFIDILPLHFCPADEKRMNRKTKEIKRLRRLISAKIYGRDVDEFEDMKTAVWKKQIREAEHYKHEELCRQLDDVLHEDCDEASGMVSTFIAYDRHQRFHADDFAKTVQLPFAGRTVPVPAGYDSYLKMLMGHNYMQFPPEEDRKPHHRGITDPEHSYMHYTKMLNGLFDGADGKQIILFGAGLMFEDYMKKYGERHKPSFTVDNDSGRWGAKRLGIEVRNPEDIKKVKPQKRHVIICSIYYREIAKQLDTMGIRDYKVYVQNPAWIVQPEKVS